MTNMNHNNWDTEEVLAFVHDVRPWRDMDQAERAEWIRRVKHIRDNVTTDDKPWTNERLAGVFGLAVGSLKNRFARSEAVSGGTAQQNSWADRKTRLTEEAAAKATAEAEAKAAKALAEALARQEKAAEQAKREAALKAKQEQERALKAQQETIRKEEQAKAKAAAEKELAVIREQMKKAAKAAAFDLSTLSDADKAKIMTLLANDPESAGEWFAAQAKAMENKNKEAAEKARLAAEQRAENKARQEEQEAAKRRSREYADSALYHLTNKLMPMAIEFRNLSQYKPLSFKDVINGDFESLDPIYNMAYALESAAASIREQLDLLNAEQQIEAAK